MPTTKMRFAALAALAATGVAQGFVRADSNSAAATACLLLSAFVAAALLRSTPDAGSAPPAPPTGERGAVLVMGIGVLVLLAGTWTLSTGWATLFFQGWSMIVAGTLVLSVGLRRFDGPAVSTWHRNETLVLIAIVVITAALRFHNYSEWPGSFTTHAIEEQQTGLGGQRVLLRGDRPWEFWLDYHLTALALYLDPQATFNTIRVPFTVASTLTVVPVYFLFRQLVQTPAAWFGTLLYALSSWNLVYSRCAHPIFLTNLLVVAVLAMLVHFGRTRRLAVLPWIGLLCGYTLYSYAGYRGTPLFAAVFLGGCVLADLWHWRRAPAESKRLWRLRATRSVVALGFVGAITVAVATPISGAMGPSSRGYYFEAASRALANREYYTDDLAKLVAQRLQRIRDSARMFMHFGDGSHTFNVPTLPMLDPATAVLFLVGLLIACLDPRRRYNGFLLFMFMTLMAVGTVFVQNLDIRRLQGITVFVAAFSAITFDRCWHSYGSRGRGALAAAGLAVVAYVGWWGYDLYFHRMGGDPVIRAAFHDHYTTLIHWGSTQTEKRPILLQSFVHRFFDRSYHYRYNYSWLIDAHLTGADLGDVTELLDEKTYAGGARTVVVQEGLERQTVGRMLEAAYPPTTCSEMIEPDSARTALTICKLPEEPGPPRITPHLAARYSYGPEPESWFLQRSEPFLGFGTYPNLCYRPRPGFFCYGEWEGTFSVPPGSPYSVTIVTGNRTQVTATVDGAPVSPYGTRIAPGEHRVRVEAVLPRDWEGGVRLVWRHDGVEEPIPFY